MLLSFWYLGFRSPDLFNLFIYTGFALWILYSGKWGFEEGKSGPKDAACRAQVSFCVFYFLNITTFFLDAEVLFARIPEIYLPSSLFTFAVTLIKAESKITELTATELQKLGLNLQSLYQQNLQLAQANSQLLAVWYLLNSLSCFLQLLRFVFSISFLSVSTYADPGFIFSSSGIEFW